jgi:Ca2+-binding RTX toxin-like protein
VAVVLAVMVTAGGGVLVAPSQATTTCTYHARTKTVALVSTSSGGPTITRIGDQIGYSNFGAGESGVCGAATVTNTDRIDITITGDSNSVTVDERNGAFVPGATVEPTGISEIEFAIHGGEIALFVRGAPGDNTIAVGTDGIALNDDEDADIAIDVPSVNSFVIGGTGRNVLTAEGGFGSGAASQQPFRADGGPAADVLRAGAGLATFAGGDGDDQLYAGAAGGTFNGGKGNDLIVGGPARDTLIGGGGSDTIMARDGLRDVKVDGGGGNDQAQIDPGLDLPQKIETFLP